MRIMKIQTPTSLGELYDKVTILEIKLANIKDAEKIKNIKVEYAYLKAIANQHEIDHDLYQGLLWINQDLWKIEDDIRECERQKEFSEKFIQLARNVYITNDKRSDIKKQINIAYGSDLVEEKSYGAY